MQRFVLEMAPVPKGRPRFTRGGRAYTPAKTVRAERGMRLGLQQQGACPYERGVALTLEATFYLARPKSTPKKALPVRRPDLDNYVKALLDAGNVDEAGRGLWHDDAQVVEMHISKAYADDGRPRIELTVRPV